MADPLSITASLIAVGQVVGSIIASCYSYQQCAKSARKDASSILLETQALRSVIERLLTQVTEDESSGGAVLTSLARMIGGDGCVFKNCQKDLVSLEERLQSPVNKWKRLGDRLLWPLRESEIVKEVENIHRMRAVIESGLAVDTAASIRQIQKDTRVLKERILDFQKDVKMTDAERLHVMLDWLSAFNPSSYHNVVRKGRTEGTGTWLLEGDDFKKWRDSADMAVLWMHGIPGCGKSVLTSSVIDHIRGFTAARSHASVLAYYYFQFGHHHISTVHSMLRSLVSQLSICEGSPSAALDACALRHFSTETYSRRPSTLYVEGVSQPSTNDLAVVLRGIFEELDEVYLVVDGLDECVDQDDLLHLVEDMMKWNLGHVHVFLAGRYQHDLTTILEARNSTIIEVNNQDVDGDIQLFIQQQLASHPKLRKWPARLQDEIRKSLIEGSQGMFRWVSCQVEVIAKCITPRDLMRALRGLPKSLSAAYESILAQIDEFHWEYATKILLWLAVSSQPLLLGEAADGLAIDFETDNGPIFDPDLRIQDIGDVINMCATLVSPCKVLQRHERITQEFTELRLAHHTVKDYLLSDFFQAQFPQPVPFTGKAQVHEFVAKTSIAYLLSLHEPLNPALLHDRPFSRRAAQFWLGHYVDSEKNHALTGLAMQLLESEEPYDNWCRLYDPTRPWRAPSLDRDFFPDPLYYISNCGVEPLVSELLRRGSDPARKGEIHGSCLQSAVYNGHYRVAEMLLQAGADPNVGGGLYDCPLGAAIKTGHDGIVKMLLEYGADPEWSSGRFANGAMLREACRTNNTFAVELLINAGASPNHYLRKVKWPTSLELASHRGFQECIKLLLPKSSRIIALRGLREACRTWGSPEILGLFKDKVPDAVLYHAIDLGHEELAREMLACGVTRLGVDRSDDARKHLGAEVDYSPAGALYRACKSGNLGLVQKLVQEGVDVDVDDEYSGSSLTIAALKGHLDVVKMLVELGCSLLDIDGIRGGPLQAAVLGNHLEVLKFLVSAGADINTPVSRAQKFPVTSTQWCSDSPLQAATSTENELLVEWLLEHGANVNYSGRPGTLRSKRGTSLFIASSKGNINLVNRLLEVGAEVNLRTGNGYWGPATALEAACEEGHIIVVERLIRAGAGINTGDETDSRSSPLMCAISADALPIVSLLLENGANPNFVSHRGYEEVTVLAQACIGENAEIVSTLLEAGADVHMTSRFDDDDEPVIQTAAVYDNIDVIRALLKHGANVNVQTSEGFTALHKAARQGCAAILQVLLSEGQADHSLRLINGSQPIHSAARWNHPECIQVLVEAGADIDSRNSSGKTPLHWATEDHCADAIRWLLSNGANAGLTEYETNMTPHDYAVLRLEQADEWEKCCAREIVELLS